MERQGHFPPPTILDSRRAAFAGRVASEASRCSHLCTPCSGLEGNKKRTALPTFFYTLVCGSASNLGHHHPHQPSTNQEVGIRNHPNLWPSREVVSGARGGSRSSRDDIRKPGYPTPLVPKTFLVLFLERKVLGLTMKTCFPILGMSTRE